MLVSLAYQQNSTLPSTGSGLTALLKAILDGLQYSMSRYGRPSTHKDLIGPGSLAHWKIHSSAPSVATDLLRDSPLLAVDFYHEFVHFSSPAFMTSHFHWRTAISTATAKPTSLSVFRHKLATAYKQGVRKICYPFWRT